MTDPWTVLEERFFRQILPVVARLKVPESKRTNIEAHARALANECVHLFLMDNPDRRHSGNAKAARRLKKLHEDINSVRKRIAELPVEATDAILETSSEMKNAPPDLWYFDEDASGVALVVELALRALVLDPAPTKPKKPRNYAARAVTEKSRAVYEELTGERATVRTKANVDGHPAHGPFLTFVSQLFIAVGIDARPEFFARQATRLRPQ